MKLSFLIAFLSSVDGARVGVHNQGDLKWGRSCESLEGRFQQQTGRLQDVEGMRAVVTSISLMRTLRRANARECDWATSGDVDMSGFTQALSHLREAPCYPQYQTAIEAARHLPEDEQESATNEAIVLLFSQDCGAESTDPPALDASEEEMEEEVDDTTDEIMDGLAAAEESSLIQEDQNPLGFFYGTAFWGWLFAFESIPVLIAVILGCIVFAIFCTQLMHIIVRIFRWMRCKMFGNSCEEYAPATWVRVLITGGCSLSSLFFGPGTALAGAFYLDALWTALPR